MAKPLPANRRLGRKGLQGKNTLVKYGYLYITAIKSFITMTPEANVIKVILSVIYVFSY
jgi:hypothetical protein